MNRINGARIALAVMGFVAAVLLIVSPMITGMFSSVSTIEMFMVSDAIGDLFDLGAAAIILPIFNTVIALSLLTASILAILPSIGKVPSGVITLIASALFLLVSGVIGIISIVIGVMDHIGWGAWVTVVLNIACFVFAIIVLAKKQKRVTVVNNNSGSQSKSNAALQNAAYAAGSISGLSGVYQGAKFNISDGTPVKFGRDSLCCQIIFDQFETPVSRVHCIVSFNPSTGQYMIRDLSKNGTFVNTMQNRLPYNVDRTIQRGTIVYIGSSKNSFRLD